MRQPGVGIAAPDILPGQVGQELGPQVPVAGFLGAGQAEREHAPGIVMGVGVEGHETAHAAQRSHGGEQVGPQALGALRFQQLGRPPELGGHGLADDPAAVGVVPVREQPGGRAHLLDVVRPDCGTGACPRERSKSRAGEATAASPARRPRP